MSTLLYRMLLRKIAAACPTCSGTGQVLTNFADPKKTTTVAPRSTAVNNTKVTNTSTKPASTPISSSNIQTSAEQPLQDFNEYDPVMDSPMSSNYQPSGTTQQPQHLSDSDYAAAVQNKQKQSQIQSQIDANSNIIVNYTDYVDNGLKALQAARDINSHIVGDVWNGEVGRQEFDGTSAKNSYEDRANKFFNQKHKIDQQLRSRGIYGNIAMRRLQELRRDGLSRDEAMKIINSEERERLKNEQWAREDAKATQSQPKTARLGSVSKPYTKVISNRYADASKLSNDALTKLLRITKK